MDWKNIKKVHMVGIKGSGLSALAAAFRSRNIEVTGSDSQIGGHKAENVPENIDCLVYTVATDANNPEILRAKELGIPLYSYPEILGLISKNMKTIAVAGTHGKTTTTNMIGKILTDTGFSPLVISGAPLQDGRYMFGQGQYFVVEACEYKRSFLNIIPDIIVITNIDEDHLDYYKDRADIEKAFDEFTSNLKPGGKIIREDAEEFRSKLNLKSPGEHNIQNALKAIAVALEIGIDAKETVTSLNSFPGAKRRFEYKGKNSNGALIFDDYAHHPTEVAATIAGAKEKYSDKKLAIIFQPHLYSRTKEHFKDFVIELTKADEVLLLPIYAAREQSDNLIKSESLAEEINKLGGKAYIVDREKASQYIKNAGGDFIVTTMGAGDVNKISDGFDG